jgi:hypothetical protein
MESSSFFNQFVTFIHGGFLVSPAVVDLGRGLMTAWRRKKVIFWLKLWYKASGISKRKKQSC